MLLENTPQSNTSPWPTTSWNAACSLKSSLSTNCSSKASTSPTSRSAMTNSPNLHLLICSFSLHLWQPLLTSTLKGSRCLLEIPPMESSFPDVKISALPTITLMKVVSVYCCRLECHLWRGFYCFGWAIPTCSIKCSHIPTTFSWSLSKTLTFMVSTQSWTLDRRVL